MQVTQVFHRMALLDPERTFTVCGARSRTVAEVADRVARLAGALRELGVQADDRVGMLALNSDHYVEYLLAVPWAGGVVNPVNIRWSPAEIAYSLVDCRTDVLLVDDAFAGLVPVLRKKAPNLATVVYCGDGDTPDGMLGYEDLIARSEPIPDTERHGADMFGIFYTGGTTGSPKGVVLSHDNMVVSALGAIATNPTANRGGALLHAAPMFHLADLAAWAMGMVLGHTHVTVPSFTPAGVLDAIEQHGVTDSLLVPTMIQMLVDSPGVADRDLSSMRRILYGAAAIPEAVLKHAFEVFPNVEFTQAYGMTELSPIATLLLPEDHHDPALLRSAGRPAMHASVRIEDADGNPVPRGVVGEICVKGDNVMQGYWNQPEQTAAAIRDGWMHTGDGGYMDERGYVFVVDRIKDMIISGGENIYSAEVENALAKHPAVAQVAVIGAPDAQWGERVHAVVVLHHGHSVAADVLRTHCRELIAGYKVPRTVEFAEALPMSGAGKILKRVLRDEHQGRGQ